MPRTLYLLLWLLLAGSSLAQQATEICGHKPHRRSDAWQPWVGNGAFLDSFLRQIDYRDDDRIYFQVPVQFWVYTTHSGQHSYGPDSLAEFVHELNRLNSLNHTGLRFYMLPEVAYVRKPKHRELRWDFEVLWATWRQRNPSAINVHLVEDLVRKRYKLLGPKVGEYRGLYNEMTRGVVLRAASAHSTLTHEVGHFFGLHHTHKNYNRGRKKQEAVARDLSERYKGRQVRNCEVKGDLLCDTPADPNIGWFVNDSCQFTGFHLHDVWGQAYQPDVSNLMGYPRLRQCRNSFSRGQKAVMLYRAYQHPMSALWAASQGVALADAAEPDHLANTAPALLFDTLYQRSLHRQQHTSRSSSIDTDYFRLHLPTDQWLLIELHAPPGLQLRLLPGNEPLHTGQVIRLTAGDYQLQVQASEPVPHYELRCVPTAP